MFSSKTKLIILFLLAFLLLLTGFRCKWLPGKVREAMKPIEINYWRAWDDQDVFSEMISDYQKLHPYITIKYKKLRFEEYEKMLLDALAEDRGPDIFSVHNTWLKKYQSKISPLPKEITLPYQITKGKIKQETIIELRKTISLSPAQLKKNFVEVVASDVIIKEKDLESIYGLPLSVDSLALFYNKDFLNNSKIANPPTDWRSFQEAVIKLTKKDQQNKIIIAGAALGTANNVERASDILSLLMMQNGSKMTDDFGNVIFDQIPSNFASSSYHPAVEALRFYTDFANPMKEVYSWNLKESNSLDAFILGKAAFFFGYSYHLPLIKSRAPKLNFSISLIPQIAGNPEMNFASYWVEVVSKKSKHKDEAWDFVQFITKAENVVKYLNKNKKPTALRSLIQSQLEDENLTPFASQLLTAKSWYQGKDSQAQEKIFHSLIEAALKGEPNLRELISKAAQQVNQTRW